MSAKRILSKEQVKEIEADLRGGMTQKATAKKYGVGKTTIYKIAHGTYWLKIKNIRIAKLSAFRITYDPAEKGAFPKGAKFSRTEVKLMLKDNVFTPGTKLSSGEDNYIVRLKSEMVKCD